MIIKKMKERMKMKVSLVSYTQNPEQLVSCAAKVCYSASEVDNIFEGLTPEKSDEFIQMLSDMGHESPIEHAVFTFAIEGISRSCSHQLVRHRLASYSQKSQRYVDETHFSYVKPEPIASDADASVVFDECMDAIQKSYQEIKDILIKNGMEKKKAQENARAVLPNACTTSIMMTMNARSLYNFFRLRCCSRAQEEIRELAWKMLEECVRVAPSLFRNAGPSCCVKGFCSEGKMCCGKMDEVKKKFETVKGECSEG